LPTTTKLTKAPRFELINLGGLVALVVFIGLVDEHQKKA
jgi:hypothetical protein